MYSSSNNKTSFQKERDRLTHEIKQRGIGMKLAQKLNMLDVYQRLQKEQTQLIEHQTRISKKS